jgi:peptidoglycan hydrolase-like protein with peptidoglycan-binding domain
VTTAVVAVGAATAAGVGFGFPHGNGGTAAASTLPPATAQVTRQTLVDTQTGAGDLGYGTTISLANRLGGTITAIAGTDTTVKRGQTLYRVDNGPVVLLYGALPAYRALASGVTGADVKQFEQNLSALGYTGFTVDETYSDSTAQAVKKWQEDLGLPKTGTVEPGRIVYTAGAVRVDTHKAEVGDPAQPGQAVLTYTGTAHVVIAKLDVADQRLAHVGDAVTVELPNSTTAQGKITKAETVVVPGDNGAADTTKIQVTIAIADAKSLAGLGRASVSVDFTASQRKDVLTVPVAALLALAEGGYGVQVVEGSATHIVAVKTGLFASGRVEVSGDSLSEGMTVGMPA